MDLSSSNVASIGARMYHHSGKMISNDAASALHARKHFMRDNTRVDDDHMYLFGHLIAHRNNDDLFVEIPVDSRTTRDRLRALVPLYSKKGELQLYGKNWSGSEARIINYYRDEDSEDDPEWEYV